MLVLLRAAQADALAALRPMGRGEAGPTSPAGWTTVRTEDADALAGFGDAVLIDESEGRIVLEVRTAEGTTSWSWCPDGCEDEAKVELDLGTRDAGRGGAAAIALAEVFGNPAERETISTLLGDLPDDDELLEGLDRILDLPEWERGRAARSVVLIHGDAKRLQRALRGIASSWSPLQAANLGGSWFAVQGLEFPGREFAEALAEDLSTGDEPVLHLWRGKGTASGVDLLRRDPPDAADRRSMWRDVELTVVEWGTGWRSVKDDPALHRDALVAEMAVALAAASGLDGRPALVRPGAGGDPLRSVVEILGIPAEAIAVLDGVDDSPVMQQVKPASILRDLWEDTRTTPESRDMAAPHFSFRTVQGFLAIVVGLCGALSLGMLALKISILATDGAVVGRPSAGPDDWIFATLFAIATAMNVGIMTLLWWRGRSF